MQFESRGHCSNTYIHTHIHTPKCVAIFAHDCTSFRIEIMIEMSNAKPKTNDTPHHHQRLVVQSSNKRNTMESRRIQLKRVLGDSLMDEWSPRCFTNSFCGIGSWPWFMRIEISSERTYYTWRITWMNECAGRPKATNQNDFQESE